jgi:hypothetical protein
MYWQPQSQLVRGNMVYAYQNYRENIALVFNFIKLEYRFNFGDHKEDNIHTTYGQSN